MILLLTSHLFTGNNSEFTVRATNHSSSFENEHDNVLSSANKVYLKKIIAYSKVIYKNKKKGPKMEPCGTPWIIVIFSESKLLIETYCFLSDKYEEN